MINKKLLGVSFEKEAYVMYAMVQKCYILKGSKSNDKKDVSKMKGVLVRLNGDVDLMSYKSCLESSALVMKINKKFMMLILSHTSDGEVLAEKKSQQRTRAG
jgi:hypothetical protein